MARRLAQEPGQARPIVGPTPKVVIAPRLALAVGRGRPESAQRVTGVAVGEPAAAQIGGPRLSVELRVVAAVGHAPNVDEAFNAMIAQQLDDASGAYVAVPDRVDDGRHRLQCTMAIEGTGGASHDNGRIDMNHVRGATLIVSLIIGGSLASSAGSIAEATPISTSDSQLCEQGAVQIRLIWQASVGPTLAGHFANDREGRWRMGLELRRALSHAPAVAKAFASQRATALMIQTPAPVFVAALLASAIADTARSASTDRGTTPLLRLALTATGLTVPALVLSNAYHALWAARAYNAAVARRCAY